MKKSVLLNTRLKANALFYALIFALLLSIFISAVIFLADLNGILFYDLKLREQLLRNAHSGINILRASQGNHATEIDLFGDGDDKVQLTKKQWGLFEIGICKAYVGDHSLTRSAQFGYKPSNRETALYLLDNDRPLSLCGRTVIKGNVFLPQATVSRAYIEGQSFIGKQLIDGEIQRSSKTLPLINNALVQYNVNILTNISNNTPNEEWPDSLSQSFSSHTIILYSDESIYIDQHYKGNIILGSNNKITISSRAQLEDILIYAPEIEIQDGFNGNIQLFANTSIYVGQEVKLNYPSSVCLLANNLPNSFIEISNESKIEGLVFIHQITQGKPPILSIEKRAQIMGQVFVDGALELFGSVYGNVICKQLILNTPSSIYENHLLNATIDYSKLSAHYIGSALLMNESEKKIVKWLE